MSNNKRGLGRGLSELGLDELLSNIRQAPVVQSNDQEQLRRLSLDIIQPGRYQPRKHFDDTSLQELADSIRAQGIIQPIIVRRLHSGRYEIIAGERRWRASKLAGLTEIPALIKEIPDEVAMALALIENIQRENLNAIEEAHGIQRLMMEFGLSHQQLAEAVGRSRSAITNLLRLLTLETEVKIMVERGELEMGHARALLSLSAHEQVELAQKIITKKLSVREAERLSQQTKPSFKEKPSLDPNIHNMQVQLSEKLGAAVTIEHQANGRGKLIISYHTLDELDGILEHVR